MHERNEEYDDMLDSCYPSVKIGAFEFSASDVLFELDPIAYRIGLDEWLLYLEEEDE